MLRAALAKHVLLRLHVCQDPVAPSGSGSAAASLFLALSLLQKTSFDIVHSIYVTGSTWNDESLVYVTVFVSAMDAKM